MRHCTSITVPTRSQTRVLQFALRPYVNPPYTTDADRVFKNPRRKLSHELLGTPVRWPPLLALCLLLIGGNAVTHAAPFGFFDPRSMAMGGAGVAAADSANAVHFNPALLAVYQQYKDDSGNSRFVVPALGAEWSDSTWNLVELQAQDTAADLAAAINAYNAAPTASSALGVASAANTLSAAIVDATAEALFFDLNSSVVVGIPSLRQGGAFYMNARAVASGEVAYSSADQQLLQQYVDGLTFIATGGAAGTPAPELIGDQGELLDQTNDLSSSARATGWLVGEAGVATADEVELLSRAVYWGVTPKIQSLSAIDEVENAALGTVKVERDATYRFRMNMDAGAAIDLQPNLRAGVVVKNLFPTTLTTQLGNEVKLQPQLRAGLAYRTARATLAADVDLAPNASLAGEPDTQHVSFGAEYAALSWLRGRAGYMHNLADVSTTGLWTAGIGISGWSMDLDIAYGASSQRQAASLRLLFRF